MPFWWMVAGSWGSFRFSSWVFFISLLSPARMAWPGYMDGEGAVFKCHENVIFNGGTNALDLGTIYLRRFDCLRALYKYR